MNTLVILVVDLDDLDEVGVYVDVEVVVDVVVEVVVDVIVVARVHVAANL